MLPAFIKDFVTFSLVRVRSYLSLKDLLRVHVNRANGQLLYSMCTLQVSLQLVTYNKIVAALSPWRLVASNWGPMRWGLFLSLPLHTHCSCYLEVMNSISVTFVTFSPNLTKIQQFVHFWFYFCELFDNVIYSWLGSVDTFTIANQIKLQCSSLSINLILYWQLLEPWQWHQHCNGAHLPRTPSHGWVNTGREDKPSHHDVEMPDGSLNICYNRCCDE